MTEDHSLRMDSRVTFSHLTVRLSWWTWYSVHRYYVFYVDDESEMDTSQDEEQMEFSERRNSRESDDEEEMLH